MHVGGGEQLRLGVAVVVEHRHAVAQPGGPQRARPRPRRGEDRRAPVQRRGQPPQRADEQPQRVPVLVVDEGDVHRAPVRALARQEFGARPDHLVARGERALHQLARGLERRRPRVEAPEEALDEAPGDLRGDHALGRRVERARRSAPASGAARARRCSARTARGRGRSRTAPARARRRACARRRAAAPAACRAARAPAAGARPRPAPARRHPRRRARPSGSAAATRARAPASATARARPCGGRGARAHPRASARRR